MSRTSEIIEARIRQLAGMKKKADGIALGDDRMKAEGDRQLAEERARESRVRRRRHFEQ